MKERLHGLDAVRGFALVLGVVLHATMSFLPGFGATGWPLADSSSSVPLGVTFYVIHIFRMTTFFVIAGFFGHLLFHREGVRGFIRNRAVRIGVPLVVGWVVLFPLVAMTMVWGRTAPQPPAGPAGFVAPLLSFPLAHLWFLWVLTLFYAAAVAVRQGIVERVDRDGTLRRGVDAAVRVIVIGGIAPVVLAAPLAIALASMTEWRPWFGVPTPDNSLIPNVPALVAFGTAFAFGWVLRRQTDLLAVWERRWAAHLVAAIVLTVTCLSIVGLDPRFDTTPVDRPLLYVACYTLAVWAWTFGLIGAALRFFSGPSAVTRYVADASYWVYLAHLPLVFFLQRVVAPLPWHWGLKFALILLVAHGVLFGTYHLFVRFTFIGQTLNGRRYRRAGVGSTSAPAEDVVVGHAFASDSGRPLAVLSNVSKKYGTTVALDDFSMEVRPGELLAVLGPNGAGKSTAISLMLGLQEPDQGTARLFGLPPGLLEARYQVGVMMQEAALSPEARVHDVLTLTASYYPAPMTPEEAMALTHTTALARRPYAKLSGGQKRQVQFAIAVCGRPALLFLDEPTVGLDVHARELLWATLRTLISQGCSIVLTTHYLEEAEALADRVLVLAKGKVLASGSVDQMRALVGRKRISCVTSLDPAFLRTWAHVTSVSQENARTHIVATDADAVVRRLLAEDPTSRDLEVQRAGLAEAFAELTQEAA